MTNGGVVFFVAEVVVFLLDEHFRVDGGIFEIARAGELPAVDGEILHEVHFRCADGVPLVGIALMEEVKGILGLVGENGPGGE